MTKIGYIYKIVSPTGKIYIGKTTRLNDRISKYKNCSYIQQQKILYSSIKKYGWDKHNFSIIAEAPSDQLSELEIFYIKEYNSYHYNNENGMNLTKGGEGSLGRIDSDEVRKKRADKIKGRKHSEETKQLMSSIKKGKPSNSTGVPCSDERKRKISLANTGKIKTKETLDKIKATKLINFIKKHEAILQIDKTTGEIIKEWICLPKDVALHYGICDSNILKCLKRTKPHTLGYIWRYKK